jgi:hypothetical protein
MLSRLRNMFRVPDLRNKILTLIIIGIYRRRPPAGPIRRLKRQDLQKQSENTGSSGSSTCSR